MPKKDQRAELDETPDRKDIPKITQGHVAAMESSSADEVWTLANMHHILVRTVGRKSGKPHKVALPYWEDADDQPIVVASYAGNPTHPAWFFNIADEKANPEVMCRLQSGSFWAKAEILDGDDYDTHWKALSADRPFYAEYQELCKATRRIPLVRLRKLRDAE
jgi:deazaflavin-dependent oxidoreductase (nitroreductase family)